MHLVYDTRELERFDFRIAETRDRVPDGARVFATCSGKLVTETLDAKTFHVMSEREFSALMASIRQARKREQANGQMRTSVFGRLLRRLFAR